MMPTTNLPSAYARNRNDSVSVLSTKSNCRVRWGHDDQLSDLTTIIKQRTRRLLTLNNIAHILDHEARAYLPDFQVDRDTLFVTLRRTFQAFILMNLHPYVIMFVV